MVNVFYVKLRTVYVQFRCTDPDWDGTATEQAYVHLFFLLAYL